VAQAVSQRLRNARVQDSSCVTATVTGNQVEYVLNACKGKWGKVTVTGTLDVTYTANADCSVDLYVQKDSPGKDRESNWLPAPPGGFVLMFRLYWPKETSPSILDGTWKPPEVKEIT
jgi:hypothetical protein